MDTIFPDDAPGNRGFGGLTVWPPARARQVRGTEAAVRGLRAGQGTSGQGTEASHCSTPAMCTVAQERATSGSCDLRAATMARCSARVCCLVPA